MNLNKFKNSFLLKVSCFILIFAMLPWEFLAPREVKADKTSGHTSYFIKTLLNSSGGYDVKVDGDIKIFGASAEEEMLGKDMDTGNYIYWSKYSNVDAFRASKPLTADGTKEALDDKSGLIFSFPSYQRINNDYKAYTIDYQRAIKVSDTLSSSLNNLISTVRSSIGYNQLEVDNDETNIANSIKVSQAINPASGEISGTWTKKTVGDLVIYYATPSSYDYVGSPISDGDDGAVIIDGDGNLMAYVLDSSEELTKDSQGFIWAMPKGYIWPGDGTAIKVTDEKNRWGVANFLQADFADARWLTIFSLAEFANAQALYHNNTAKNTAAEVGSFIESTIYNLVLGIYSDILNILKLNTIPELIYNGGTRGGSGYEAGMMNSSWWSTVLKYHLIFQILAWMMLIAAIAKILLQVNFSTVNPQLTISVMDTLQKIFTVGFALALCVPFIKAMAELNNLIVGVFQTQARTDEENLSAIGIAGIIILFGYLGITFTLNCIYIMRAIMIAILTASAPLFITSMAFAGPKQKGLFDNWFKEITANIFMQAIHAFAFAFLFDVLDASSVMVQLVIYFSLLPIVDMFRQLIFANAGGFAVSQGKAASQTVGAFVAQTAGGAAKGGLNLGVGAINKKLGAETKGTDDASGEKTSGEGKASESGSRLNQNVSSLGNKLKENGANIDTSTKSGKAKALALKAGGSMLNGGSKMADYMKSTGGIMGNAVTKANLGDVNGSVNASKTYGEGVATGTERVGHDATAAAKNGALSVYQRGKLNSDTKADNAENAFMEAVQGEADAMKYGDDEAITMAKEKMDKADTNYQKAQANSSKWQKKIDKNLASRGSSISSDGRGNKNISLSSSRVSFDSGGQGYAYLEGSEPINTFGENYSEYQVKEGPYKGAYKMSNNYVTSKKSDSVRFTQPIKDNYEKQYDNDKFMEKYHNKGASKTPTTVQEQVLPGYSAPLNTANK